MTDDITAALHRAAELLPDAPDRLSGVRRKRASRVRRRATAALGLLAVVGAGTAYGLTRGGGGADTVVPVTGTEQVTATGRVVQVPGKPPRFCAPVASTLELVIPKPPPAWCELGVDVRGVDFATLDQRYEKAGAVEGYATLTGQLDGDVLVVTKQEPQQQDQTPAYHVDPPCPAPAGGWHETGAGSDPDMSGLQAYQAQHAAEVAMIAVARPSSTVALPYLLTWGDPAPARAALRSAYGDQFCVLQSRWTKAEVADAVHELTPTFTGANGIYSWGSGQSLTKDGQISVDASAVRSTPELEAMVARHPKGLISIDYWLHPVTG
jgi:hypothetical protein